jgi:parallel beta-helix repeat protein
MLTLAFNIQPVKAGTIIVPDDYPTIQAAIDAASPDDTLIVKDGTYTENVDVTKRLTIKSENGAEVTIVRAAISDDYVFEVTADNVTISGFTITGYPLFRAAVYCYGVRYSIVSKNIVKGNSIFLYHSSDVYVLGNLVSNIYKDSIRLESSTNCHLINNTMLHGSIFIYGYSLEHYNTHEIDTSNILASAIYDSSGNIIKILDKKPVYYWSNVTGGKIPKDAGEVILANSKDVSVENQDLKYGYAGIEVAYSSNITLKGNKLELNMMGIYLYSSKNNNISNNYCYNNNNGIDLERSNNNTILSNNCTSNTFGIGIWSSWNNTLTNNSVTSNSYGILLVNVASQNVMTSNTVLNNKVYGIYLESSSSNIIYLNNFNSINNVYSSNSINTWNSPQKTTYTYSGRTYTNYLGNYWSDYTGGDVDGDGIGDAPYSIDGDKDNYPLMGPFENYGITPAESPWPMFQHDPQRTGSSPYVGPQTNNLKWVFTFEQGMSKPPQVPSVGASGIIYISHYAIKSDGSVAWITPRSIDPFDGAAIASDGTIYASYGNDVLYAVNPDGSLKWKFEPKTGLGARGPYPALASDGTIYVPFLYGDPHFITKLFALTPEGTIKWSYQIDMLAALLVTVAPDGTIYWVADRVYAIHPDGRLKWIYKLPVYSYPTVSPDGTVYVCSSNSLYAIHPAGTLKWKASFPLSGWSSIALGQGGIIYVSSSKENTLYALNYDGSLLWSYTLDATPTFPAVDAEGTVYIATIDYGGYIYAINADGSLKWKYLLAANEAAGSPVIGENGTVYVTIYVADANGKLYAFGPTPPAPPPIQAWLFDSDFQYNLDDDYATVEGTGHLSGTATFSAGILSIEGQITLNGSLPSAVPEVYLIATDGQDKELAEQAVDLSGFSYWQTGSNTYNFTGQIPNVIQPTNNGHYEVSALITYNAGKYEFFVNTTSLINNHYFPLTTPPTPPPPVPGQPPQPINISPHDGATDVSLEPQFLSSPPLSDVTSEQIPWEETDDVKFTRVYYHIQITTVPGDYSTPVYNFTDFWLIDQHLDFPPGPKSPYVSSGVLDYGTTYYWRIRYKDFRNVWSPWSEETSFTTVLPTEEIVRRLIQQGRIIERDVYVTVDEIGYIIAVLRDKIDPDTLSFIPDSGETKVYIDVKGYAISDGEVARKIGQIDLAQKKVKELDLGGKINELRNVQSATSDLNLRDLTWGGINLAITAGIDIEKVVNEMTVLKTVGDSLTTIEKIKDLAKTQPIGLLQRGITYLMRKLIWDPYGEVKVTLEKALSDALTEYTRALNLLEQKQYKIEDFQTANEFLSSLYHGEVYEEVARHLLEKTFKNWGKLVLRILSFVDLLGKIPIIKNIPGLEFVALVKEAADALDWLNDADYVYIVKNYEAQANLWYKLSDDAKYTLRLAQASAQVQDYNHKYLDYIAEGYKQGAKLLEEAIPFSSFSRFLDSLRSLKLSALFSPGELRIYDSQNRVTGLIYGQPLEEIPDSLYDDEINIIIIFNAIDTYRYEVVGTDKGSYGLEISSIENGSVTTFIATDIPISVNATHQYTIDWDALSMSEEGVTVMVDSNGDGIFEHTFTSDGELTYDEFMLQTATTVDFDPDTLNLKSKGSVVTVYIELPEGYDVSQIDVSSIMLNGTVPALAKPTEIGDSDGDGIPDLMVKFDRAEVISYILANVNITKLFEERYMTITLTITGCLNDGTPFQGSTTIKIIMPMPRCGRFLIFPI